MISSTTPANPHEEFDGAAARRRRRLHRQAASVVLTAILVAVVVALSCGICGVVAVLYRRRRCDRRAGRGLGCDDDDDDDDNGSGGVGDGTEKTTVIVDQQRAIVTRSAAAGARERQSPSGTCRRTDYEDTLNGRNADALRPLLQVQRHCGPAQRQPKDETKGSAKNAVSSDARTADTAVANTKDRCGGPDVVMSTAATLADTGDMPSGNWQQKHQSRQMTFNAMNSNRQWSLQRLEFQIPNTTISRPRATLSTTTTPTAAVVFTNNHTKPNTIQTIMDEPLLVTSQVLLNALHRESSI